jgi:PAS domain S-box-containing protein
MMENRSMELFMWILLCLMGCLGVWGAHRFQRQKQTLQRLRHSLRAAHQQIFEQENAHSQSKEQWAQTEERLRGYLQLLDTLINTIPNPIFFKDAQGVYQGCNNVFAKQVLGLTRDRIIGKRPQDLTDQIPADLAAAYQREEIKMIYKADFHTFETKVQCADGQRRDFLFSLAPVMDEEGRLSGSVAILADLTEKNSALRDRMQKEKLEGVLETAGAVCHELNQPLQALSGYTELIAMKLSGDETLPYARKIISQVDRMRDITLKLQSITRYETTDYAGLTKIIDINKASAQG